MKELSIEEKAKRYDEALKRAKKLYEQGTITESLSYVFPELKESEDEKLRKEMLQIAEESEDSFYMVMTPDKRKRLITWLEKQGEKGSIDDLSPQQVMDIAVAKCFDEQKPTDKVEPKFKVEEGKWYICISQFCNCIEGRVYKATSDSRIIDDFGTEYDMHSDAYKYFRLWTIQDAKPGDVLAFDNDTIVIFKDLYNSTMFHSYCYFEYDIFDFSKDELPDGWESEGFKPATKEQRDLLFQKMKEAGYEWDAERKKLKKVKQNPYGQRQECTDCQFNYAGECKGSCQMKREEQKPAVWSKDDEGIYQSIIDDTIQEIPLDDKQINWLKSLKNRVQPQPKQEWSEEDERTYKSITYSFANNYPLTVQQQEFVKSLKERYVWKPSDDQMKALGVMTITGGMPYYAGQKLELINLYNDLKKLKGK